MTKTRTCADGEPLQDCGMTTMAKAVTEQALTLPEGERAALAETLLASLAVFATPKIEHAWRAEVRQRVEEIDAGRAELIPSEEVHRQVRAKLDEIAHLPRGSQP